MVRDRVCSGCLQIFVLFLNSLYYNFPRPISNTEPFKSCFFLLSVTFSSIVWKKASIPIIFVSIVAIFVTYSVTAPLVLILRFLSKFKIFKKFKLIFHITDFHRGNSLVSRINCFCIYSITAAFYLHGSFYSYQVFFICHRWCQQFSEVFFQFQ